MSHGSGVLEKVDMGSNPESYDCLEWCGCVSYETLAELGGQVDGEDLNLETA